jgi:hypothetical protein
MAVKKIKPTNPDTEKAEADDTKATDRKTAGIRIHPRVSGRKTSGIQSGR